MQMDSSLVELIDLREIFSPNWRTHVSFSFFFFFPSWEIMGHDWIERQFWISDRSSTWLDVAPNCDHHLNKVEKAVKRLIPNHDKGSNWWERIRTQWFIYAMHFAFTIHSGLKCDMKFPNYFPATCFFVILTLNSMLCPSCDQYYEIWWQFPFPPFLYFNQSTLIATFMILFSTKGAHTKHHQHTSLLCLTWRNQCWKICTIILRRHQPCVSNPHAWWMSDVCRRRVLIRFCKLQIQGPCQTTVISISTVYCTRTKHWLGEFTSEQTC